ncbi:MAG TPA: hypothetical protein VLL77_03195 [Anaerolineales bacterium]|nr:hypothetical protein [Anaerolineales bacterium]
MRPSTEGHRALVFDRFGGAALAVALGLFLAAAIRLSPTSSGTRPTE